MEENKEKVVEITEDIFDLNVAFYLRGVEDGKEKFHFLDFLCGFAIGIVSLAAFSHWILKIW